MDLLYILLQVLIEVFGQVVIEILWGFVTSAYQSAFDRPAKNAITGSIGLCLVGTAIGGLSLLIWPDRVLLSGLLAGINLVLSPLVVGWALHRWGVFRQSRGHWTSGIASFWGGASFAFGTAIVRFVAGH